MLKKYLKNERGLTLIELLAVIVIIGIIAAIAVPAIGNIIDNSRRDAHVANARMMADSARMFLTANPAEAPAVGADTTIALIDLQTAGLMPAEIQVPGGGGFYARGTTGNDDGSFVLVHAANPNDYTYTVTLVGATTANGAAAGNEYIDAVVSTALNRAVVDLDRSGAPDNAQ